MIRKMLTVILLVTACALCGALAEEVSLQTALPAECPEGRFSVQIPAGYTAGPDEAGGLLITPEGSGESLPRIQVLRRNHPFNNPVHYLTEICDVLDRDQIDYDMEAGFCDFAGERMIRADYAIREDSGEYTVVRMISTGQWGDTEFVAAFSPEDAEKTLKALETIVTNYAPEAETLPGEIKIRPLGCDPEKQDFANGRFAMRVEDTDRIPAENCFTAVLYQRDRYAASDIAAMTPGDTILINDRIFTVAEQISADDKGEVIQMAMQGLADDEEYDGWFEFRRVEDEYCVSVGDWGTYTRVGAVRIELPLPEDFRYFDVPGGMEPELRPTEKLIGDLESIWSLDFYTQYNTECRFRDGRLAEIVSRSYPFGPYDLFVE